MSKQDVLIDDISPEWLRLAKKASQTDEVFIFSPYITGNMLLQLREICKAQDFFVVSFLSPEAYLGGSLDVDILLKLMTDGVKIFNIPKLHAKLMFTANTVVVGSQNFTDGGLFNLEASATLDLTQSRKEQLLWQITEILKSATVLNRKIIEFFVEECEKQRNDFERLQIQLDITETKFENFLSDLREKHKNALEEVEEVKREFSVSYSPIAVYVANKPFDNGGNNYGSYYTLRSPCGGELLNVFHQSFTYGREAKYKYLEVQQRYLCMDLNSLRLFWIPANKRQIAKFGITCQFTNWPCPDGTDVVNIDLQNPHEVEDFSNMKVSFNTEKYGLIELGVFFSGKSFHVQSHANKTLGKPVPVILDWTEVWDELVLPIMLSLPNKVLTPFEYSSKNYDVSPARLFNEGQGMELGLQVFDAKLFYTLL